MNEKAPSATATTTATTTTTSMIFAEGMFRVSAHLTASLEEASNPRGFESSFKGLSSDG